MSKSKFFDEIKSAVVERECEAVYNKGINLYFPNTSITHPFACDGFLDTKTEAGKLLKLIIEYKFDELLSSKTGRAKVLIQVVFYMKQFELNGLILPNVCMVGDVNECFVIHTNALLKYLDEDVEWSVAPSTAHNVYPDLVLKIANDEEINPFVFNIDENFSFKDVAQKITDLADNVQRYVHVTEHNIATIYDYFCRNVIKNVKKIKSHDLVGIFMGVITNGDEYYQHPTKKNILVTPLGNIDINGDGFKSFFSYFQRNYTPQEKNNLTAIADRLIEDTDRRNSGDFWTPTLFVDYAHKMISEQLGEDWKDKYVVWDNCCGSKNLTRDYKFKELYCSTLFESELKIGERYNKEAISFQYDFLNDDLEKLPKGLIEAFEQNKPIVFFLNPPYGAPGHNDENGKGVGGVTAGVVNTKIASEMKSKNIGRCSSNLYTQFLYRINNIKNKYNLTNIYIAIFSPKSLLTSSSYNIFRNIFLNNFKFVNACQFQASHFANVASSWAISFSIWKNGINENKNDFVYNTIDNVNGNIQIINKSIVYNIDGRKPINDFIEKNNVIEQKEFLSCGALMKITGITKMPINSIGGYYSHGNDFMHNTSFVNIFPTGKSICESNFEQVCTVIGTRKLIEVNWENNKNEHILPNYIPNNYINNCIVYCLFNPAVYNYSLRNIKYDNKLWDIKNEFFWMSKSEIESLANEFNNDDCYSDVHTSEECFVYKKLQGITLTSEAQAVLDKACEIVRKTFKYREMFNEEHPEYQINNWDCGWYQIKALAKEFAKDDLNEFKELYKNLTDKMRPMVYELGFLK